MNKKHSRISRDVTVIGLTGGSGAGKSIVSITLRAFGIPVLDTDKVSRAVCEPGQPCLSALCDHFGRQILNSDGTLNRKGLAAFVFGEPDPDCKAEKLHALNTITHRYIMEACHEWIDARVQEGFHAVCIDAPQLFESGFDQECGKILTVTAEKETRIARIIARDFATREEAERRIAAQHDDAFFALHSDAVIENNGSPDEVAPKVEALLRDWGLL
ncbi:MAG: dephospho-CoA kinase [Clostridia bacterium]|nr:dephospho-CoA kinase [Clostridia bacterium]